MAEPVVVFEDENLVAIWQEGIGDLLITFSGAGHLVSGRYFFADRIVAKLGIPCLGFVAKKPNWYPILSMHAAVSMLAPLIEDYKYRTIYGSSMGGYAAIKFSAILRANTTISYAPQWSINEKDCEPFASEWSRFFDSQSGGLQIRPQDVSGDVYVFYDANHHEDDFHKRMIVNAYSATQAINVPNVGHEVAESLAGSETFKNLLQACKCGLLSDIIAITQAARRKSTVRIQNLMRSLFKSNRNISFEVMDNLFSSHMERITANRKSHWFEEMSPWFREACLFFIENRNFSRAALYYEFVIEKLPSPSHKLMWLSIFEGHKKSTLVSTWNDSILVYNVSENNVVHRPRKEVNNAKYLSLEFDIKFDTIEIFINFGSSKVQLGVDDLGYLRICQGFSDPELDTKLQLRKYDESRFYIFNQHGKHMCAENTGRIIINRDSIGAWELFKRS